MDDLVGSFMMGEIDKSLPDSSADSPADKSKSKGGRGSKKQVFEPYMTPEEVSHGLKRGELIQVQIQSYRNLLQLNAKTPLYLKVV